MLSVDKGRFKVGIQTPFDDCCTQQHGKASVFCSHLFLCQIIVSEQNVMNFSECRLPNSDTTRAVGVLEQYINV